MKHRRLCALSPVRVRGQTDGTTPHRVGGRSRSSASAIDGDPPDSSLSFPSVLVVLCSGVRTRRYGTNGVPAKSNTQRPYGPQRAHTVSPPTADGLPPLVGRPCAIGSAERRAICSGLLSANKYPKECLLLPTHATRPRKPASH